MARSWSRTIALLLVAVSAGGCSKPAAVPRTDTGAEAAAKSFFDALVRGDWSAAYDTIDRDDGVRLSREQFDGRARAAIEHVGFAPTAVSVVVSEIGDQATAVAVFRGAGRKQYRDGASLRRTARGWVVVLRQNFGTEAPGGQGRRMKN